MSNHDFNTATPDNRTIDGTLTGTGTENFSQTLKPSEPDGNGTHEHHSGGLGGRTWALIGAVALLFGLVGGVGGSYVTSLVTKSGSTNQQMQAPGGQQNGMPPSGNSQGGNSQGGSSQGGSSQGGSSSSDSSSS
ncbi:MAG: hypothetical protein ABF489_04890 [Bifidobacterium sp.]|uniref:hypothetical protein n=1 Tax=Bifidobacterium sp. TaxID=41200 RepID=UPI0039E9614B